MSLLEAYVAAQYASRQNPADPTLAATVRLYRKMLR